LIQCPVAFQEIFLLGILKPMDGCFAIGSVLDQIYLLLCFFLLNTNIPISNEGLIIWAWFTTRLKSLVKTLIFGLGLPLG
jgi:hypothetical protein